MDSRPTAFGVLLKRFRGRAGLTQEALAERAGLNLQTITKLERGVHRTPRSDTVQILARSLHLTPQERTHLERAALHPRVASPTHGAGASTLAVSAVLQALATMEAERSALIDIFVSTCPDEVAAHGDSTIRVTIL